MGNTSSLTPPLDPLARNDDVQSPQIGGLCVRPPELSYLPPHSILSCATMKTEDGLWPLAAVLVVGEDDSESFVVSQVYQNGGGEGMIRSE